MAVHLSKGQKVELTKGNPNLTKVMIGLGWDVNQYDGSHDFDLDAAAFLLNKDGKCERDFNFIFYNNLESPCGSVTHSGDNLTGGGDGDDEQLVIDLAKVPANVERIAFTVTIHDAIARAQSFGQVSNAFVRLLNQDTGEEILRYDLGEDFSIETAVVFCELYRHNGEWKFNAIGSGYQGGLAALVNAFGLSVA
ncbi:TerD family protein [Bacillus thuringiensis]|uniref:TerD family protein n=1 Tax=Bacillus thuringiensis TaxID=1428 RepID=UPI000B4357B8|nr:TerD family protein [Bacillus thuringiensis]MEB9469470.1 TerD family protein [Bacillus cereus]OUA18945.1 chemical-damaging agent resistance protein C [Bacillus thuringiensis serovar aizawai]PFC28473.1 chemical-damaging agent resistance protein C [Bacillus thuringiensis]